jgi:SAM-dependent methyltransferase
MSDRFQKVDEEGFLLSDDGARLGDESFGREFLSALRLDETYHLKSSYRGTDVFVEAFDDALVVKHLALAEGQLVLELPYHLKVEADLNTLRLDEWDRFHGLTKDHAPFVFSRQAQVEFFDLLDAFDDDSVTMNGMKYDTPPYFVDTADVGRESFWSGIYQTEEPGWDLKEPARALKDVLPQLKLARQRVLVLGCGRGHDAAFLAQQGHLVTAVDLSPVAIEDAKNQYSQIPGLQFIQADAFALPKDLGPFDLIFEHTFFCAIPPEKRGDLIKTWRRLLAPGGHLLAIFYVMPKPFGPPFGASEWELKERLKKGFDFRYWTRWRHSLPRRQGKELVVYAEKRP